MSVLGRIDRKIRNMSAMLSRIGIDPAVLAQRPLGTIFTTSMRACLACPNGDICTAWLDQARGPIDHVPEFCPNGRRFERTRMLVGVSGTMH